MVKSKKRTYKRKVRSNRKSLRRSTRRSTRKSTRKSLRRSTKKSLRRSTRKSLRRSTRKSTRKSLRRNKKLRGGANLSPQGIQEPIDTTPDQIYTSDVDPETGLPLPSGWKYLNHPGGVGEFYYSTKDPVTMYPTKIKNIRKRMKEGGGLEPAAALEVEEVPGESNFVGMAKAAAGPVVAVAAKGYAKAKELKQYVGDKKVSSEEEEEKEQEEEAEQAASAQASAKDKAKARAADKAKARAAAKAKAAAAKASSGEEGAKKWYPALGDKLDWELYGQYRAELSEGGRERAQAVAAAAKAEADRAAQAAAAAEKAKADRAAEADRAAAGTVQALSPDGYKIWVSDMRQRMQEVDERLEAAKKKAAEKKAEQRTVEDVEYELWTQRTQKFAAERAAERAARKKAELYRTFIPEATIVIKSPIDRQYPYIKKLMRENGHNLVGKFIVLASDPGKIYEVISYKQPSSFTLEEGLPFDSVKKVTGEVGDRRQVKLKKYHEGESEGKEEWELVVLQLELNDKNLFEYWTSERKDRNIDPCNIEFVYQGGEIFMCPFGSYLDMRDTSGGKGLVYQRIYAWREGENLGTAEIISETSGRNKQYKIKLDDGTVRTIRLMKYDGKDKSQDKYHWLISVCRPGDPEGDMRRSMIFSMRPGTEGSSDEEQRQSSSISSASSPRGSPRSSPGSSPGSSTIG